MIKASDLDNRHFDKNEPEPKGAADVHADRASVIPGRPAPLEQRLLEARSLQPPEGRDAESWTAGRDAALKVISGA